jgi:hypothetical protein
LDSHHGNESIEQPDHVKRRREPSGEQDQTCPQAKGAVANREAARRAAGLSTTAQCVIFWRGRADRSEPSASDGGAKRAFAALCDEIIDVSRHITELFGELIGMLGQDAVSDVVTEQVPDGPKLSTFSLPYFFDENDGRRRFGTKARNVRHCDHAIALNSAFE